MDPKFLEPPLERFGYAIGVHERLHLQIGGELRRAVFAKHGDIDAFFHKNILPLWLDNKLELPLPMADLDSWKNFYPGDYAYKFNLDGAIETLDIYFNALKHNAIEFFPNGEMFVPNPKRGFSFKESPMSVTDLYKKDPENLLKMLITGYAIGEKLREKYMSTMEYKYQRSLWEYEEIFANYISSSLTGVKPEELQRVAPQDLAKLSIERFIKSSEQISVNDLIRKIQGYDQFAKWLETI